MPSFYAIIHKMMAVTKMFTNASGKNDQGNRN